MRPVRRDEKKMQFLPSLPLRVLWKIGMCSEPHMVGDGEEKYIHERRNNLDGRAYIYVFRGSDAYLGYVFFTMSVCDHMFHLP